MRLKTIALACALFGSLAGLQAQNQPTDTLEKKAPLRVYNTIRLTTEKPVIDGRLDDPCWKTGQWSGDFTQWIPKEGAKPSQDTRIKILYDDKNLYVALRAFDTEPSRISRKAGRRDELTGDMMGITFDSYHDHRTGFEFTVTAAGQKVDMILTNPMEADFNWNAVWYVKTGLEDSAWVAEYEIPLSQLRYSRDEQQVWGLHVWRWIDRLSEESDWEVQSLSGPGMLYLFGELRGIKGLPESRRIEIMPYALGKLKTFEKVPGNPFADQGHDFMGNIGLDAKIGLSSNFTADLTVNPDFGQVESDPSVMNLTAFETFYEEKRPFFLEGKNIFSAEMGEDNLFYSRRIGQTPEHRFEQINNRDQFAQYPDNTSILSAVKISGKSAKGLAVGVLHSMTAAEKAQLSLSGQSSQQRVTPLTSYSIGRLQQDFKEGNTVLGAMLTATNRFIEDDYLQKMNRNAFTGGVDFLHQWRDKEFFLDARLIGSSINGSEEAISRVQLSSARYFQRPDSDTPFSPSLTRLSGHGGRVKIGKGSKGLLRYSTEIDWKSPGLELNDVGFMQMADIVHQETEISYFVTKPVSIFRTYTVGVHQNNQWDYQMNYENSSIYGFANMEFLNRWAISPSASYQTQTLDTRLLRGGPAFVLPPLWEGSVDMRSDHSKKVHFSLSGEWARAEDNHFTGTEYEASATVIPFNILKLSLSVNYSENQDNLQYVGTYATSGQTSYLLAHLNQKTLGATFRVDYNITPEVSLQYYGSPFSSTGKYSAFKEVSDPRANRYTDRFTPAGLTRVGDHYTPGPSDLIGVPQAPVEIPNPDFTFTQFRSNLVFRWEYRPGSQLFLVWANERTGWKNESTAYVEDAIKGLRDVFPNNIFLVKLNYWFSL